MVYLTAARAKHSKIRNYIGRKYRIEVQAQCVKPMDIYIPIYRRKASASHIRIIIIKQGVECVDDQKLKKKELWVSFVTTFVVGLYHNIDIHIGKWELRTRH